MKYAAWIVASVVSAAASYFLGYSGGFDSGLSNGYVRGQVELSLDLKKGLGNVVNKADIDDSYTHFMDVKDVTIYIRDVDSIKTIAFWE